MTREEQYQSTREKFNRIISSQYTIEFLNKGDGIIAASISNGIEVFWIGEKWFSKSASSKYINGYFRSVTNSLIKRFQ